MVLVTVMEDESSHCVGVSAAKVIAQHFSQDIHSNSNEPAAPPPHFDPLHGGPICLKSITRYSVDSIIEIENTKGFESFISCGLGLLESYASIIRPRCFIFATKKNCKKHHLHNTAHIILSEFEILLSKHSEIQFNSKGGYNEDINSSAICGGMSRQSQHVPVAESESGHCFKIQSLEHFLKATNAIHQSIDCLASDIFALTEVSTVSMIQIVSGEISPKKVNVNVNVDGQKKIPQILRDSVLPIMIRILEHCIHLLRVVMKQTHHHEWLQQDMERIKKSFMISAFAATAFCSDCQMNSNNTTIESSSYLSIMEVLPRKWQEEQTFGSMFARSLAYLRISKGEYLKILSSLPNGKNSRGAIGDNTFLRKRILDLDGSPGATMPMPWIDNTNGVGFRAGTSLLQSIGESITLLDANYEETSVGLSVLNKLIRFCGEDFSSKACRDHIFGRLQTQMFNAREDFRDSNHERIQDHDAQLRFNGISTRSEVSNVTFDKITSGSQGDIVEVSSIARIVSTIRILAAFRFPSVSSTFWSQAIPMLCSLADSINAPCQAFGASLLIHLFNESTPSSFISLESQGRMGEADVLQILSKATKTGNVAVSLSLIHTARTNFFTFTGSSRKDKHKLQREALRDCLLWVRKKSYCGPGGDADTIDSLCVTLTSGVHPLLEHLAHFSDESELEIGRLGMATLLPLIRWDSVNERSRKIQYASISCLINLMICAYPIMPRHGGKLMAELLSCIGRLQRDTDIQNKVHCNLESDIGESLIIFAVHAASITLSLCGERANEVLLQIESQGFIPNLVYWCNVIRSGTKAMKQLELPEKHQSFTQRSKVDLTK
uniref:Uncharacterized protein n=1 Tax=Chaetoceros debilis TaxID=122233 RepID=A0A7S3PTP5_9STRA